MPRPYLRAHTAHTILQRSTPFTVVELAVVLLILAVITLMLLPILSFARSNSRRINCAGQLKQIGVAMLTYSSSNGRYLPIDGTPGSSNFEPLNSLGLLADGKVYACPAAKVPQKRASQSNYIYVGSGLKDTNQVASQVRIAFDASGNHPNNTWMIALFLDGHAEGARPDGTRGWNTYTNPTSPDPAGTVPLAPTSEANHE